MTRLALMGGTFDPIHTGHLRVAEVARETLELTQVVFVPNRQPVHKPGRSVTDAAHRVRMAELATANNPAFTVSRAEADRDGPSYAIDTVRSFQAPDTELFWIVGADTVPLLPTWYLSDELSPLCTFVSITRPGYDSPSPDGFRVHCIPAPGLDISSSDLRERVRAGQSIRYLVPDAVLEYIAAHGLHLFP